MPFPDGLRALNHPDFRHFFSAQLVSQIGTWMQSVAQAWLVLQLTDSPLLLGLIGTLQFGPMLLFSVVSGAIADRLPKRQLLMATQTALAAQALTLAVLVGSGHVQYWHVGVLAALAGFANTLDNPARQSFVVEMVGKDDVINAIALNSAAFNAARIIGPVAAGLLIARFGVVPAFVINGTSFLGVLVTLGRVRAAGRPRRHGDTTMRRAILEGLRYALRAPEIRLILTVLLVVSLCVFNFSIYVPLLARTVLGLGAEGFGFLMAAVGVGAVTGALTLGTAVRRSPPPALLFTTAGAACAALVALSLVRHVWLAALALFVTGFAGIMTVAGGNTALQIAAPDHLRGRVMSLHVLVFGGSVPIGAFVVGAISERWGVSTAFFVNGAAGLLALAGLLAAGHLSGRRPEPER
ncbi:MAG TPA: MFS transporter [Methylomirabilota bacterium]|jgi:predicted MFS family arabinose efflux permease